jgi:hypothetical protein
MLIYLSLLKKVPCEFPHNAGKTGVVEDPVAIANRKDAMMAGEAKDSTLTSP